MVANLEGLTLRAGNKCISGMNHSFAALSNCCIVEGSITGAARWILVKSSVKQILINYEQQNCRLLANFDVAVPGSLSPLHKCK